MVVDVVFVVVLSVMASFVSVPRFCTCNQRCIVQAHARIGVPIRSAIVGHLDIMVSRGTMHGARGPPMATTHGPGAPYILPYVVLGDWLRRRPPTVIHCDHTACTDWAVEMAISKRHSRYIIININIISLLVACV